MATRKGHGEMETGKRGGGGGRGEERKEVGMERQGWRGELERGQRLVLLWQLVSINTPGVMYN